MAKLKLFLTLVISFSFLTSVQAQFSRADAIHLILNQVLITDTGHINVYCAFDMMIGDDSISLPLNKTINCPYNFNWVFFVDDNPLSYWIHPADIYL